MSAAASDWPLKRPPAATGNVRVCLLVYENIYLPHWTGCPVSGDLASEHILATCAQYHISDNALTQTPMRETTTYRRDQDRCRYVSGAVRIVSDGDAGNPKQAISKNVKCHAGIVQRKEECAHWHG